MPNVHVLLESYRPGVMEKLGLSPSVVHDVNPSVIFVRLSGYGQGASSHRDRAGHDLNYLAVTGVLNKFRRVGKGSAPTPPANMLADFASGSLYSYNLVLQALTLGKQHTTLDCSLAHQTAYLSQPVLLETVKQADKAKNKNALAISNFLRPHETVYRDKDGVCFVLQPGSKIYENAQLQFYTQDEAEESHKHQDLYQIVFEQISVKEIAEKYGPVEVLKSFETVLDTQEGLSPGLVAKSKEGEIEIMNVFASKNQVALNEHGDTYDGWAVLASIGVDQGKVQEMKERKERKKQKKKASSDFRHKL